MTTLSEQLEAIFQDIKNTFSQHQQIYVTPLTGTPPEQYRITYYLQGFCKEEGGEVRVCANHVVTLTLPFGFPHFPPNCKPESPVFHPDFDQAAICIGEFWEKNHSLSDLIFHIGHMVCGEIYSTHNAFNEEAAIWYKENQNRLPLDTIHQSSGTPPTPLSPLEKQPAASSTMPTMESVDKLLAADDEITEVEVVDSDGQGNDSWSEHGAEKSPVPHLAENHSPAAPQNGELDNQTHPKIKEARQRYQEGEDFEHQGQPAKALERYKRVKKLVPDFPDIDKDINRAQYSLEMLGDWAAGGSTKEGAGTDEDGTPSKRQEKQLRTARKKNSSGQQEKKKKRRPAMVMGIGSLGFLLILASTYFFLDSQWRQAQTVFAECQRLLETYQYPAAERKCTEALDLASGMIVIRQEEKKLLMTEIRQLQSSIKTTEGVASKELDSTLPEWQQFMKLADQHLAAGLWKDALTAYSHTLKLASEVPTIDPPILEQIRGNMTLAEFNTALQTGEQALARGEWDSAPKYFDKAMELARKNQQIPSASISRIQSLSGQVEFNILMASGDVFFTQGDWTKALTAFEQAQELERKFTFSDATTLASLQEIIIRTKVFNSLDQGKNAFADAQWDQAISHYEKALQLLEENSEILRRDNPLQSQQKISRLMLHAAIIRDKQSVANHLKNKEFSEAIDKMQSILETTNMSSFASEAEFQAIITETGLSINQAREDLQMAEQLSYLTDNYQKLFLQNNPSLAAERLSHPRVIFLKKIGHKQLYRIQCIEEGHSSPVLLQASYLYDPTTKKWQFHSNESSGKKQAAAAGQKR